MGKGRRNQLAKGDGNLQVPKGGKSRKGRVPVQQGKGTFRTHLMKNFQIINKK